MDFWNSTASLSPNLRKILRDQARNSLVQYKYVKSLAYRQILRLVMRLMRFTFSDRLLVSFPPAHYIYGWSIIPQTSVDTSFHLLTYFSGPMLTVHLHPTVASGRQREENYTCTS